MEVLDISSANTIENLIKIKTILENKEDPDLLNQVLKQLLDIEVSYEDLSVKNK